MIERIQALDGGGDLRRLDLLGRATDARTLAEAALSAAPRCRDAHRLICELLGREKDWPALLERSDKGIATFERHGDFQIQRATALRGLGKNDEARDILEAEVRKNPQDTGPMSSLHPGTGLQQIPTAMATPHVSPTQTVR